MPNWVKNVIKTDKEVMKDIMSNYSKDGKFSFDKVIPMPKDLDIESGSRGEDGLQHLFIETKDIKERIHINEIYKSLNMFHDDLSELEICKRFSRLYILNNDKIDKTNLLDEKGNLKYEYLNIEFLLPFFKKQYSYSKSKELGQQYINNYDKYGHANWHEWCEDNWGTKWDTADCRHDDTTMIYETAWGFSGNVILELSKKYPEAVFECSFADEGIKENSGIVSISNGEIIREEYNLSNDMIDKIWNTCIQQENEITEELDLEDEIDI